MDLTTEQKQIIIVSLFIVMCVLLVIQLAYFRNRKKKNIEKIKEPLSDKTFNKIHTTEKILGVMRRQGIDVSDAESALREARRLESRREYNMALGKCDEAKALLQRAKAQHMAESPEDVATESTPPKKEVDLLAIPPVDERSQYEPDELDEFIPPKKGPDEPPAHYMQAKFILNTVKGLLDEGKGNKEAHKLFGEAMAFFDEQNYSKALSTAIKAEKLLDESANVNLIAESRIETEEEQDEERDEVHEVQATEEYMEELTCHNCEAEVALDDAFCRKCGEKLEFQLLCPGCEAEVTADDAFCRKCGEKLIE